MARSLRLPAGAAPPTIGPVDPAPDERSRPAELELALSRARWARRYRELLIDEVGSGRLSLVELLDHDRVEPLAGTIKVVVLLQALPGVGKVRARRGLDQVGAGESIRMGALSPQQRSELAGILSGPSGSGPARQ